MLSKKFILLFFALFLSVALVNGAGPIASIPNYDIPQNGFQDIDVNSYFGGYENISLNVAVFTYEDGVSFFLDEWNLNQTTNSFENECMGNLECVLNVTAFWSIGNDYDIFFQAYDIPAFVNYTITVYNTSNDSSYWMQRELYLNNEDEMGERINSHYEIVEGYDSFEFYVDDYFTNADGFELWYFNSYDDLVQMESNPLVSSETEIEDEYNVSWFYDDALDSHVINITGGNIDYRETFFLVGKQVGKYWLQTESIPITVEFREEGIGVDPYDDSLQNEAPKQFASFGNVYLEDGEEYILHLDGFFENYEFIRFSYDDDLITGDNVSLMSLLGGSGSKHEGEFGVELLSAGVLRQGTNIRFEGLGYNGSKEVTVRAVNEYGSIYDTFNVYYFGNGTSRLIDYSDIEPEDDFSFVGAFNSILHNLYPDENDLSTRDKFGYVFISLLIPTILLLWLGAKSGGDTRYILYLIVILNFLMVFYFIALGYISITFLIVFTIVGTLLAWLRLKNI